MIKYIEHNKQFQKFTLSGPTFYFWIVTVVNVKTRLVTPAAALLHFRRALFVFVDPIPCTYLHLIKQAGHIRRKLATPTRRQNARPFNKEQLTLFIRSQRCGCVRNWKHVLWKRLLKNCPRLWRFFSFNFKITVMGVPSLRTVTRGAESVFVCVCVCACACAWAAPAHCAPTMSL